MGGMWAVLKAGCGRRRGASWVRPGLARERRCTTATATTSARTCGCRRRRRERHSGERTLSREGRPPLLGGRTCRGRRGRVRARRRGERERGAPRGGRSGRARTGGSHGCWAGGGSRPCEAESPPSRRRRRGCQCPPRIGPAHRPPARPSRRPRRYHVHARAAPSLPPPPPPCTSFSTCNTFPPPLPASPPSPPRRSRPASRPPPASPALQGSTRVTATPAHEPHAHRAPATATPTATSVLDGPSVAKCSRDVAK